MARHFIDHNGCSHSHKLVCCVLIIMFLACAAQARRGSFGLDPTQAIDNILMDYAKNVLRINTEALKPSAPAVVEAGGC